MCLKIREVPESASAFFSGFTLTASRTSRPLVSDNLSSWIEEWKMEVGPGKHHFGMLVILNLSSHADPTEYKLKQLKSKEHLSAAQRNGTCPFYLV